MTLLAQPAREDIAFTAVMHALSDPVRLRILAALADGEERSCHEAAENCGVHVSTSSHHFRVMREAGVLSARKVGRTRYVRIRRDDLDTRFPGVLNAALTAARELQATPT
ncbi:ArsR/SmtB family transcription factor [Actinomadura kijaniata]|uniref:ArsR/SmtB family transcription factor n=1 Tax=Actinomadura kijaniata TaxID=46161 RepID=UPI00082D7821|nr:metalloregulator ArsR/SmtB family transcription factor [Actinomadura kijaniata]